MKTTLNKEPSIYIDLGWKKKILLSCALSLQKAFHINLFSRPLHKHCLTHNMCHIFVKMCREKKYFFKFVLNSRKHGCNRIAWSYLSNSERVESSQGNIVIQWVPPSLLKVGNKDYWERVQKKRKCRSISKVISYRIVSLQFYIFGTLKFNKGLEYFIEIDSNGGSLYWVVKIK